MNKYSMWTHLTYLTVIISWFDIVRSDILQNFLNQVIISYSFTLVLNFTVVDYGGI